MRSSPARRYILCRLLDGASDLEVQQELADRQIDAVPFELIQECSAELAGLPRFDPRNRSHIPSQRFIFQRGLRLYFHPDDDMRSATVLLDQAEPREFVEVLLVSGADEAWVASAATRRGSAVSARAIRFSRHFYFDLATLSSNELPVFLARRRGEQSTSPGLDSHMRAARSRTTGLGALLGILRSGSMPSSVQLGRILKATQAAASVATLDASLQGDSAQALRYVAIAKAATEIIELVGDPSGDLQHELRALMLTTDTEHVPHVAELGGSYTTDVFGAPAPSPDSRSAH